MQLIMFLDVNKVNVFTIYLFVAQLLGYFQQIKSKKKRSITSAYFAKRCIIHKNQHNYWHNFRNIRAQLLLRAQSIKAYLIKNAMKAKTSDFQSLFHSVLVRDTVHRTHPQLSVRPTSCVTFFYLRLLLSLDDNWAAGENMSACTLLLNCVSFLSPFAT